MVEAAKAFLELTLEMWLMLIGGLLLTFLGTIACAYLMIAPFAVGGWIVAVCDWIKKKWPFKGMSPECKSIIIPGIICLICSVPAAILYGEATTPNGWIYNMIESGKVAEALSAMLNFWLQLGWMVLVVVLEIAACLALLYLVILSPFFLLWCIYRSLCWIRKKASR